MIVWGLWAAAATIGRAVSHRLALDDPRLALRWRPDNPEARTTLSSRLLGPVLAGTVRSSPERARTLDSALVEARRALAGAPMEALALRNIGLVYAARNDTAAAERVMTRAGLHGLRDVATDGWLLRDALARRDLSAAVAWLDALLRTEPNLTPRLMPVLGAMASQPEAIDRLVRHLAARPPWRSQALLYLSTNQPSTLLAVYRGLQRTGAAPIGDEATATFSALVDRGLYAEAHVLWIAQADAATIKSHLSPYDGNFEGRSGSPPFNWQLFHPPGTEIRLDRADVGATPELLVDYPADTRTLAARQLLILPPGAYALSGRYRIIAPVSGVSLSWTVQCLNAPATLATVRQKGDQAAGWQGFAARFVVPAGCGAQWLSLEGLTGDGFGEEVAAYTALRIQAAAIDASSAP